MDTKDLKPTSGSTLVLFTVIIAMAALLVVAVIEYKDYIAKAKMAMAYELLQSQMNYVAESYAEGSSIARITLGSGLDATKGITARPSATGGTVTIYFLANSSILSGYFDVDTGAVVTYTATPIGDHRINWTSKPCTIGPANHPHKASIESSFFPGCILL